MGVWEADLVFSLTLIFPVDLFRSSFDFQFVGGGFGGNEARRRDGEGAQLTLNPCW